MHRLVLWDVDGTLVRTGGAGRDVFESAVAHVLGRELDAGVMPQVSMSGKTDPQIAAEILTLAGIARGEIDAHVPPVLARLELDLAEAAGRIRREGVVLPGVAELLARLHGDPGVLQSVLTGNVAANAVVKLAAFGLDRWLELDVGAYGSDAVDRRELVPIAIDKVARRHGRRFEPAETWIVGDTPRDLECARAGGARCLLVGTGRFAVDELTGLGADAVLADLGDVDTVVSLLAS